MNTAARARAHRAPLRTTLILTAALSGTGLLLAACSGGSASNAAGSGSAGPSGVQGAPAPAPLHAARAAAGVRYGPAAVPPAAVAARLLLPPSIIHTASLNVQVKDVTATADRATSLVNAVGGYVSNEQETITPGIPSSVSMELKIPVAQYDATLSQLQTLGKKLFFSQQAQDVTQQVADVSSRVASAQAAIRQLRALLSRAGSVGDLLAVQDEINAQESSLEALLAQQQALAHETSYATVSLLIVSHHVRIVKHKKKSHGFGAGLSAGWRALRAVVTGLLTALGAALPFILIVALLGGIAYGGRRRVLRRRTPSATPPPPAAS